MSLSDTAAERAVLGAVLLDQSVMGTLHSAGVGSDDFSDPANRLIFEVFSQLDTGASKVDIVTISGALNAAGDLDAVGGFPYLAGLSGAVPSLAGVGDYIASIKDKALLRRVVAVAESSLQRVQHERGSGADELEAVESALLAIRESVPTETLERIGPISERVFNEAQAAANSPDDIGGLSIGFTDVEFILGKLKPGHLHVLAARPGMGKTAAALNILSHLALRERAAGLMFSLEMPRDELVSRMMCSEARVSAKRMREGRLRNDDWSPLLRATEELQGLPIYIDDRPAVTLAYVRSVAKRVHARRKLGLIVIDYVQLMRGDKESRREGRQHEVAMISQGLKALAKELGVPVLLLAQLNRECERRTDKRPILSDLRESGAIEQDADTVSVLYRDEYYHPEKLESEGIAEWIVRKNRHGGTGTATLAFRKEFTRFENLASRFG